MPDVTSTLLAMYQQIIGGSSAREQASLEAECARRIITSGLTIAGSGAFTIPGNVTVGGTLSVNNFSVTGSFSVPGTLTVGTLSVTGAATVGGTLGVSGLLTAQAGLAVTGSTTLTGTASVSGALTASAGLTVTGTATMDTAAVTGNATLGGVLTVNGFGNHLFSAGGVGANLLSIRNPTAGATCQASLTLGSDASLNLLTLRALSSTYSPFAYNVAGGAAVISVGAGGLSLAADQAAGMIRFYTGGSIERLRIDTAGALLINSTGNGFNAKIMALVDLGTTNGMVFQNSTVSGGQFHLFYNSVNAQVGGISMPTQTSVSFNTTSDRRLKVDAGVARDLRALRAVVVHDFVWKADGVRDRGIFAQEAHALYPRAITPGTDQTTETGDLTQPWQTDYSKFVPDLIAGWQQHDAALADLRAALGGAVAQQSLQILNGGAQDPAGDPTQILPVLTRPARRGRRDHSARGGQVMSEALQALGNPIHGHDAQCSAPSGPEGMAK